MTSVRDRTVVADQDGWGWQVGAVWIGQLLSVSGFGLIVPFLPLYLQTFGLTDVTELAFWTGAIVGVAPLGAGLSAPIWGAIGDRFGLKPMVVRSQVAGGLMVGLMAFAPNPATLLVLRALQGAMGGNIGPTAALAAGVTPPQRVSFSLGLIQMAVFAGGSLGPLFGGVLADTIGVRWTFLVTAACLGLAAVCVTVFVRPPRVAARPEGVNPGIARSIASVLTMPALLAAAIVSLAIQLTNGVTQPVLPLAVQTYADTSSVATMVGILYGTLAATSAISAVAMGRLGDSTSQRSLLIVSLFGSALLFVPQAVATTSLALILSRVVMGLFIGGGLPAVNVVAVRLVRPDQQATAISVVQLFSLVGLALGPLTGAALVAIGGLAASFWFNGALLLAMVVWVLFALPTRRSARS